MNYKEMWEKLKLKLNIEINMGKINYKIKKNEKTKIEIIVLEAIANYMENIESE